MWQSNSNINHTIQQCLNKSMYDFMFFIFQFTVLIWNFINLSYFFWAYKLGFPGFSNQTIWRHENKKIVVLLFFDVRLNIKFILLPFQCSSIDEEELNLFNVDWCENDSMTSMQCRNNLLMVLRLMW